MKSHLWLRDILQCCRGASRRVGRVIGSGLHTPDMSRIILPSPAPKQSNLRLRLQRARNNNPSTSKTNSTALQTRLNPHNLTSTLPTPFEMRQVDANVELVDGWLKIPNFSMIFHNIVKVRNKRQYQMYQYQFLLISCISYVNEIVPTVRMHSSK